MREQHYTIAKEAPLSFLNTYISFPENYCLLIRRFLHIFRYGIYFSLLMTTWVFIWVSRRRAPHYQVALRLEVFLDDVKIIPCDIMIISFRYEMIAES